VSSFHREYRAAKRELEETDAKLAALLYPSRNERWRLALTFGPVIILACCLFVVDVLRQALADAHKALFFVLSAMVEWSARASAIETEGQDAEERLGAKHESAVAATSGETPTPNPEDHPQGGNHG
jgi:hypothetical protein